MLSAYAKLPKVVVLDSDDTDMYVQAADVSHQLQGNLRIKCKNEFISCSAVLSEDVAHITMPLYDTTSSDHTSVWLLRPLQKETAATSDQ